MQLEMFKQEDFVINDPEFINDSEFINNPEFEMSPDQMETFNITVTAQDFRMNSQEFSLHMNELVNLDGGLLQLSPQDDATMDVASKFNIVEFVPVSPRGPPERTVFPGDLDFQVEINGGDTNRKKYLYSNELNRIYVDMKIDFPVSFRWEGARLPGVTLYVRATVVFSDDAQAEKRVERCTQHTHDASNAGIHPHIVKNVLRSSRSAGTAGVYYCGRADEPDCWYSVLLEMPLNPAGGSARHAYQFVCKNSCSSGINRRAIDVIFTLENASGHVYGRQVVGARVCACPRRDMLRDQEAAGVLRGKRRATVDNAGSKKIKLEVVPEQDESVVVLPPLEIVGVRPMITGLEVMASMMEQAASFKKNDPQATEKYTKSLSSLRTKIDELKKLQ